LTATTPAKRIVLAIGLPGSGKSAYFARQGITPLSSDLLRKLLWGEETDQRLPHFVFGALRYLLRLRLMAGARVTFVDATNITRRDRRHFFRLAEQFGCAVDALYFDTPLEMCLERNRRRPRRVPEAAVRRMAARLQPPTRAEGFRRIVVVRTRADDV
jgi:predicted kinase